MTTLKQEMSSQSHKLGEGQDQQYPAVVECPGRKQQTVENQDAADMERDIERVLVLENENIPIVCERMIQNSIVDAISGWQFVCWATHDPRSPFNGGRETEPFPADRAPGVH